MCLLRKLIVMIMQEFFHVRMVGADGKKSRQKDGYGKEKYKP